MSLRWRIILVLLAITVSYTALLYGVQRVAILPSFEALEQEHAGDDLKRCLAALKREPEELSRSANDWSAWDDTYRFMQDRNPVYAKTNLEADPLKPLKLDFMCLCDTQGRVVWGKMKAGGADAEGLSDLPWRAFAPNDPLLSPKAADDAVKGLYRTPIGLALVAARPILTSENKGPTRGTVIMGRFLNSQLQKDLAGQTLVSFHLWPLGSPDLPAGERAVLGRIPEDAPLVLSDREAGMLREYHVLPDLEGRPSLLVRVDFPRTFTARGLAAMHFALLSLLASGGCLLLVTLVALQLVVVRPLSQLKERIAAIGQTGDLSARVPVGRTNEIGALARAFNAMLASAEARERLLAETHSFGLTVATTIPSALVMLDAQLNVLSVNRRFEEQFAALDPEGKRLDEVLPAALLAAGDLLERVRQVVATGGDEALSDVPCPGSDGRERRLDARICGFGAAGGAADEARRVLLVLDDVTHQHRLEEQLRHAAKMEAVGVLAGGVAHEFNNLLTGISGYAQLAAGAVEPDTPLHNDLAQVTELTRRAADLTGQLTAFSRRDAAPVLRPVDLSRLVQDTLKMLERLLGEDVEVDFQADPQLDHVWADSGQLTQVLMNLAANARDAMPSGGRLAIEAANTDVDEAVAGARGLTPGPYVVLTVTDTGLGMDHDTQQRVFEPFFTTKGVGAGTGLGLAVVYGIVAQHAGRIEVASTPGQGTTFSIYLPRTVETAAAPARPEAMGALPTGTETILAVEDEDSVLQLAVRVLEAQGYRVLAAAGPDEAEALFARHRPEIDLLVTDVIMPGRTGFELYARLAALQPGLRVLATSGYSETVTQRNGNAHLDLPLLRKPFTPAGLAGRVREVLDAPQGA